MKVIDSLTARSATSFMVATSQVDSGHPVARKTLKGAARPGIY